MKTSAYNYIIDKGEWSYWYNGFTHTSFKLPLLIGTKLKDAMAFPNEIKKTSPVFYDKLRINGFLIDDTFDEIEAIRSAYDEAVKKKDYFLVILPTLNCNFKCWYCVQDHIKSRMSDEMIEKVKTHLEYMINVEKIESLHLEWFGGEPLMYFKKVISPICQFALDLCTQKRIPFYSSATTNGYFLTESILSEVEKFKFEMFHITLDGPKEQHDKVKYQDGCESAFERTLLNIENALTKIDRLRIRLRINYTNSNLSQCLVNEINEIISPSNRGKITVSLKKVWQEKAEEGLFVIKEEVLNSFKKSGYKVVLLDATTNYMSCYTNKIYYNAINYNGNIIKCTACNIFNEDDTIGILNNDGSINCNEKHLDKFRRKTFENKKCLACKYLPICMGPCAHNYSGEDSMVRCKLDGNDINLETSIVNYIDAGYECI